MEFKVAQGLGSSQRESSLPHPPPLLNPAVFDMQAVNQRDEASGLGELLRGAAGAGGAAVSRGAGGEVGGEPSSGEKGEPGAERGTNPLVAHNLERRLASP